MPHQTAVTIGAPVAPGRLPALREVLLDMHRKGAGSNEHLPLAELTGVHFARLFVLDEETDLDGTTIPPQLFYMCDVDGSAEDHLAELVDGHGAGLDAVFGHCVDFPEGGADPAATLAWLQHHRAEPAANYVHAVGRSVSQVRDEARLREAIEELLDRPDAVPAGASAREAHRAVRDHVRDREDLRWAMQRPRPPALGFRLRELAHLVLVPAVAVVAVVPLLVGAGVLLVVVRLKELRDRPDPEAPTLEHVAEREQYEDLAAQNPFTAVGFVKPGAVRTIVMKGVLLGLDYANRHVYHRDNLAGVRTIHFARWVPIDDGRRLIFASSYDGSLESYMDDFINRLAWGLNAVFSNGVGWPRTRWLLLGGARDEVAFKNYLRKHQVPTPVWYTAYDSLTARNIDADTRLREELREDLDEDRAGAWLRGL